jgi:hypothetical protein
MKRPISYYGGKHAIIRHILPLVPKHEVYRKEIEHRLKVPRKSGATKIEVLVYNFDPAAEKQPTLFA